MTTADARFLTSDSTCVTADGLSTCHQHGGNSKGNIVGPGFLVFFQYDKEIGGGSSSVIYEGIQKTDRRNQDDEEILLLLRVILGGHY